MSFEFKLSQAEIEKAISAHVGTLGINTVGKHITVEFTATRKGGAGYSAVVKIGDAPVGESAHVLDNATVAEASNLRTAVIKQTGTDALGHAAENKAEIPNAPVPANAEEIPEVPSDDVELPAVTPETAGHPTTPSRSLFDQ